MSGLRAILLLTMLLITNIIAAVSYAQKTPKTLLWRISGKGLQRPSYLFGTMHLSDKRLFRFDDSVYKAIEQTSGLAIEINPDEMVAYYINKMFDQMTDNSTSLKDLLGDNEYKKYSGALEKRFKKPADKITTRDVFKEKNKWVSDYVSRGQMPTFVDAYLYNVARRQGKWVGGIEDLTDQTGLMNEMVDKSDIDILTAAEKENKKFTVEDLIRLYREQDLDGIDQMINSSSRLDKYNFLTKRNIKMARRMDSLSRFRSMFFAVGAAHLPGDSGVISLLRAGGFTVTPVFSETKTAAADYTFKEVPLAWYDVKEEQGLYTAKMPGNPASVKMYGIIETKMLFDIFNMNSYMIMSVISTANESKEALYDRMAENMTGKKSRFKEVTAGDISGREYTSSREGSQVRVRMFNDGSMTHLVMVSGLKKESVLSEDAERFLNSFRIRNAARHNDQQPAAITFSNPGMAISMETPVKLTESRSLSKDNKLAGTRAITYSGTDARNKAYILFIYKEPLPGHYIENDSTVLAEIDDYASDEYDAIKLPYRIGSYTGIARKGKKGGSVMDMRSIVRGNKHYTIVVVTDSVHIHSTVFEDMFASLKLLPYAPAGFSKQTASDGSFSTTAPPVIKPVKSSATTDLKGYFADLLQSGSQPAFISYDSATSTSYLINTDTLDKYFWVNADTTFWNSQLRPYYSNASDKIISERKTLNGKDEGKEWLIRKERSNVYERLRVVRHGHIVYTLRSMGEKELMTGDRSSLFFNDFKPGYPAASFVLSQSKAAVLLEDLKSKDSMVRDQASRALYNITFSKRDLPLLHKAMFGTYEPGYPKAINYYLIDGIAAIGDSSTLQYIRKEYPSFGPDDNDKRELSLLLLSKIPARSSYQTLLALAVRHNSAVRNVTRIQGELTDNLALLRPLSGELLKLAGDTSLGLMVAALTDTMLAADLLQRKDILPVENSFISLAKYEADRNASASIGTVYNIGSLIRVLSRYDDRYAPEAIRELLHHKNGYIAAQAAIQLLQKGYEIDSSTINRVAADSTVSYDFYKQLKVLNKKELFPLQYRDQRHFATWHMYQVASPERGIIRMKFLAKKQASFKNKLYQFYLYRITYANQADKDTTRYLGIVGCYDVAGTRLTPVKDSNITGVYLADYYDRDETDRQFRKYIADMEESTDEISKNEE